MEKASAFFNLRKTMKVLLGPVTHEVKVTRLKGIGWGIRVFVNGELNQEAKVESRLEIGPTAKSMLRMEDKCGNLSDYADKARFRNKPILAEPR